MWRAVDGKSKEGSDYIEPNLLSLIAVLSL